MPNKMSEANKRKADILRKLEVLDDISEDQSGPRRTLERHK
jgi:hypothetical protein